MSDVAEILGSLEVHLFKLMQRLKKLQQDKQQLQLQLGQLEQIVSQQKKTIKEWQQKYNSLEMASSILGSNDNTTQAKLKINSLIREIDLCITQLSDQ